MDFGVPPWTSKLFRFGSYSQVSQYPYVLSIPSVSARFEKFYFRFTIFRGAEEGSIPTYCYEATELTEGRGENQNVDGFFGILNSKLFRVGSYSQVSEYTPVIRLSISSVYSRTTHELIYSRFHRFVTSSKFIEIARQ